MGGQFNSKIVGATVIGFALVAGAYTISNFGESNFPQQPASVPVAASAPRVEIAVTDNDNNGIEDWRDTFVTTETVVTETLTTPYTPPETLTGQTGVSFIEGIINSKLYAPFAPNTEEIITNTVDSLERVIQLKLLDISDISVMDEWDDQDIVNYANTVAATIYRHSDPDLENEILILNDIVKRDNLERMPELESKALAFQKLLEDTLKIPVPKIFTKEHLDLVSTYQAVASDVLAMTKIIDDPLLSLIHLKRYPDDNEGMTLALQNMYLALEDYGDLFTNEDPALFFMIFSPDYQP